MILESKEPKHNSYKDSSSFRGEDALEEEI